MLSLKLLDEGRGDLQTYKIIASDFSGKKKLRIKLKYKISTPVIKT